MSFGDAVHVMTQIQSQKREIQLTIAAEDLVVPKLRAITQHRLSQRKRKPIVTGCDWCVRREHALASHFLDIFINDLSMPGSSTTLFQQFQSQQCSVAFVEMKAAQLKQPE